MRWEKVFKEVGKRLGVESIWIIFALDRERWRLVCQTGRS